VTDNTVNRQERRERSSQKQLKISGELKIKGLLQQIQRTMAFTRSQLLLQLFTLIIISLSLHTSLCHCAADMHVHVRVRADPISQSSSLFGNEQRVVINGYDAALGSMEPFISRGKS